jgi:SNF2 family DNA or RNA helicase
LCEGRNPKLSEVLDVVEQLGPGEKVVIWCRFSAELRAVADALTDRYGEASVAEYHGKVSSTIKADGKARFINDPDCRYFVAQVRAGATGTDGLQTVSNYMIFYSNDYSYLLREQAIARQARTGGRQTVNVIDIMANDTVDEDIVQCMRVAEDVHERVLSGGIRRRRTPVAT